MQREHNHHTLLQHKAERRGFAGLVSQYANPQPRYILIKKGNNALRNKEIKFQDGIHPEAGL